jgi:hypothetical protein
VIYALDQKSPTPDWLEDKRVESSEDVRALGQKVERVLPAIDLLIHFGDCLYPRRELCGPLYGWSMKEYVGRREFDKEADTLVEELIVMAVKENKTVRFSKQVARLKNSIDYLAGYKNKGYFLRTQDLMCGLA